MAIYMLCNILMLVGGCDASVQPSLSMIWELRKGTATWAAWRTDVPPGAVQMI